MLAKPRTWFCRLRFQFLEQGRISLSVPVLFSSDPMKMEFKFKGKLGRKRGGGGGGAWRACR